MIKIVADSSCDIYTFPGVDFTAVPLSISAANNFYRDDEHLNVPEMLTFLRGFNGRSYTACPSVDDWMRAFEGADTVFVVTITGGLSGSHNSAMAARELYLQTHPETKIYVYDSLSTGPEPLLLIEKLAAGIQAGTDPEVLAEEAKAYLATTRLFFSLQSVHNLAQNGRVSKVVASAVGVLNIRIVGTASLEGTLETLSKTRGDRRALDELMNQLQKAGYRGGKVRISHVQNPELAETFAAKVRSHYPDADITCYYSGGLCSYYAEQGALLIGIETDRVYGK